MLKDKNMGTVLIALAIASVLPIVKNPWYMDEEHAYGGKYISFWQWLNRRGLMQPM